MSTLSIGDSLQQRLDFLRNSIVKFRNVDQSDEFPYKKATKVIVDLYVKNKFKERQYKLLLKESLESLVSSNSLSFCPREVIVEHIVSQGYQNLDKSSLLLCIHLLSLCIEECESADFANEKQWVSRALESQALYLEILHSRNFLVNTKFLKMSHRVIFKSFVSTTFLPELYFSSWSNIAGLPGVVGVAVISQFAVSSATELLPRIKSYYLKNVMNGKFSICEHILNLFSVFISSLSTDDWLELEDSLGKLMKKSPESAAVLSAAVCAQVSVDLSCLITDSAAQSCLRMLKSANEDVRKSGIRLADSLVRRCSKFSSFANFLGTFNDALTSKVAGAGLVHAYQRVAVATVLAESASSLEKSCFEASDLEELILGSLLPVLCNICEKEVDDDVKSLIISAIGLWTRLLDCEWLPPFLIDFYKNGIGRPRPNGLLYLGAMNLALGRRAETPNCFLTAFQPLLPVLMSIIKESAKKVIPTAPTDLVLALVGCLRLSKSNMELFVSSNVLSSVLASVSCLTSNAVIKYVHSSLPKTLIPNSQQGRLYVDQCIAEAFCEVFEQIGSNFVQERSRLFVCADKEVVDCVDSGYSGGEISAVKGLIGCALVPKFSVRKITTQQLTNIVKSFPACIEYILTELWKTVETIGSFEEDQIRQRISNFKMDSLSEAALTSPASSYFAKHPPASHLVDVLLSCLIGLKESMHPDADVLDFFESLHPCVISYTLLITSHPRVSNASKNRSFRLWRSIMGQYLGGGDIVSQIFHRDETGHGAFLCKLITQQASSECSENRATVAVSIEILKRFCGYGGLMLISDGVLPELIGQLRSPENIDFSSTEIDQFIGGKSKPVSAGLRIEDIKITNADRKKVSSVHNLRM